MVVIRALLLGLAISSLATADDWSSDIALVKDMVVLDKAYIPALLTTKKGDESSTEAAVGQFAEAWVEFQSKWNSIVNKNWQKGFESIDGLVAESTKFAVTDIRQAHFKLREIRQILLQLREKENIPYFVDFVTSVEFALDDVMETVAQDRNKPMTPDERDSTEKQLLRAKELWNVVAQTRLDKIVYRIDIYYMGDVSSTRAEGVLLFEELTRDVRTLERNILIEKVERVAETVQHFLEILGSTPGA